MKNRFLMLLMLMLTMANVVAGQWKPEKNKAIANGSETRFEVYYENASEYSLNGIDWEAPNLPGNGYAVNIKNNGSGQVFFARKYEVGYLLHPKATSPLAETSDRPGGGNKSLPPVEVLKPNVEAKLKNSNIGLVGVFYNSNSKALAMELDGGEWSFEFYGNAGVDNYPALRAASDPMVMQKGDLVAIHLPTHSVVNKWGSAPARSNVIMKLYDASGALVWQLYDTKSGYHPNAFGYNGQAKRGNNHPDDACRWILKGKYRLYYKNISTEAALVQDAWFGTARVGTARITQKVKPGEEVWFDLDMSVLNDRSDSFKINCNYY